MPLKSRLQLILLLLSISSANFLSAEENNDDANTQEPNKAASTNKIAFSVKLKQLAENNSADNIEWIDTETTQHLLLIHSAKGRNPRGHVLLLHAQGENPDHQRFILPISHQLARLGWKVFVPSFAQQDYPIKTIDSTSSDNDKQKEPPTLSPQEQPVQQTEAFNPHYFTSDTEYQNYYQKICQAVLQQSDIKQKPIIIIANQNAAYWSLPCLKMLPSTSAIIFIHPQLPFGVKNDLEQRFTELKNPYFTFFKKNRPKDPFMRAFKKQIWRTNYLRFNIGMYSVNKLLIEDNQLVKTITGWLDQQSKAKKR